jgi:hypothetical protein
MSDERPWRLVLLSKGAKYYLTLLQQYVLYDLRDTKLTTLDRKSRRLHCADAA